MKNFIVLTGPPAGGKGTLSKQLKDAGYVHMSVGDMFRREMSADSMIGKAVKKYMESGNIVPNEITNEIILNFLQHFDFENQKLVLDGYPRTLEQAELLKKFLDSNYEIDAEVLFINESKETLLARTLGRRVCPTCGAIYNINNALMSPKVDGRCDLDNSELEIRIEDNEETFQKRYGDYLDITYPGIEYLINSGIAKEVNVSSVKIDKYL